MPPLPVVSGLEARKAIEKAGWRFIRQKGSHMVFFNPEKRKPATIPNHKTIDRGTLKNILHQTGLSVEEFLKLLKE